MHLGTHFLWSVSLPAESKHRDLYTIWSSREKISASFRSLYKDWLIDPRAQHSFLLRTNHHLAKASFSHHNNGLMVCTFACKPSRIILIYCRFLSMEKNLLGVSNSELTLFKLIVVSTAKPVLQVIERLHVDTQNDLWLRSRRRVDRRRYASTAGNCAKPNRST